MKAFGLFLNLFASFSLLITAPAAQAASVSQVVQQLNYAGTTEAMESSLLAVFKTQNDQQYIKLEFVKFKKITSKWLWRFEENGKNIDFRLNGKVQFSLTPVVGKADAFLLNGKEFKIDRTKSIQSNLNRFDKIFKSRHASFDQLLFPEANAAIWPFFVFGAAVIALLALSDAKADTPKGACKVVYRHTDRECIEGEHKKINLGWMGTCRKNSAPNWCFNAKSRVEIVARNYAKVCGNSESRKCRSFKNIDECVHKKIKPDYDKGWWLSRKQARSLCTAAWNSISCPPKAKTCSLRRADRPKACATGRSECCPKAPVCADLNQGQRKQMCDQKQRCCPSTSVPDITTGNCPKSDDGEIIWLLGLNEKQLKENKLTEKDSRACFLRACQKRLWEKYPKKIKEDHCRFTDVPEAGI